MKGRIKISSTLVACFLSALALPFSFLMAEGSSSSSSQSSISVGIKGPAGPIGPIGDTGARGPTGERGVFVGFDPVYASLYVTYDPAVDRVVESTGEKTIPFNSMGLHSGGVSFDSSTNRVALQSGIYRLSYQMMLSSSTIDPVITKIFLRLYPSSGSSSDQYTDWVHVRDPLDPPQPNVHGYFGDTLVEIPDDTSYKVALIFEKDDPGMHQYDNPDVSTYPLTSEPCYPVKMTLEKIAKYKAP